MKVDFSLLQLLSSRLAHDLIGSVGNLGFAIDMLKDEPNLENQEALSLANTSTQNLIHRLSFFRMAFGFAKMGSGAHGFSESKKLLINLFKEKNIKINWDSKGESLLIESANNDNLKLIFNTFLIIYYATPKTAKISVFVKDMKDKIGVALAAEGSSLKLGIDNLQALRMEIDEKGLTARNIHSYFTALLAKAIDAHLEVHDNMQDNIQIAYLLKKIPTKV